jgi:hypothetical protein|tara:strand:+ start:5604 stop:6047 length:444 start_codon:yes stop_codon:yes gene_type:complete
VGAFELFKIIIIIQLAYGVGITLLMQPLDAVTTSDVQNFQDTADDLNATSIANTTQNKVDQLFQISQTDIGSVVYFSPIPIISFMINTAFAFPQIVALAVNTVMFFMNLDTGFRTQVVSFFYMATMIIYILNIASLLLSSRTGRFVT